MGAGTVGTELAGEIAHAHPEKKITLVASDAVLFPPCHQKWAGHCQQSSMTWA